MRESVVVRRPEAGQAPADQFAVIDVGSNTARLVVFDTTPEGGFRSVFESKEIPRLGQAVGPDGSLAPEAVDRGVAAMRRFARQLESAGNPPVVAVATSAVRDAPNGPAFVDEVERATKIDLRVLTGEAEARYAYLGVAGAWELRNDLIVDIGGGSLQAAATRAGALDRVVSLPLGALRLTERFFEHDPPKRREVDELREFLREELRELPRPRSADARLFGVGGTIRCLARVAIELGGYPIPQVHGYPLRRRDLEAVGAILFEMDASHRKEVPGISNHRADLILAGLVTVEELLDAAGANRVLVSGTGIREGIALERTNARLPAPAEQLALRSVSALAQAFGFSLPHGEEVRTAALQLFDVLEPRYRWTAEDRTALLVAALLHDVGTVVDMWRHPRHSAYLLRHSTILGLTHREILIAALASYLHEGDEMPSGWRKEFRPVLDGDDLEIVRQFGTILFFAETIDGAKLKLAVPRGTDRLVLTPVGSPGAEASERAIARLEKPLRRTFGLEVVVRE